MRQKMGVRYRISQFFRTFFFAVLIKYCTHPPKEQAMWRRVPGVAPPPAAVPPRIGHDEDIPIDESLDSMNTSKSSMESLDSFTPYKSPGGKTKEEEESSPSTAGGGGGGIKSILGRTSSVVNKFTSPKKRLFGNSGPPSNISRAIQSRLLSPLTPLTTIKDDDRANDVNDATTAPSEIVGSADGNHHDVASPSTDDVSDGILIVASSSDDSRDGNAAGYEEFLSVITAASSAKVSTPTNSMRDVVRDAIQGEEGSGVCDVHLERISDDEDCRCACLCPGPILRMLRGSRTDVIHPT